MDKLENISDKILDKMVEFSYRQNCFVQFATSDNSIKESMENFLLAQNFSKTKIENRWQKILSSNETIRSIKKYLKGVKLEYMGHDKLYFLYHDTNDNLIQIEIK